MSILGIQFLNLSQCFQIVLLDKKKHILRVYKESQNEKTYERMIL